MNHLTACIGKVGLAPFVGDTLTSKAFSPTNTVYVHEIIEQARLFSQGFQLNDSVVGLEENEKVGPGGNFLSARSTRQLFRKAYYNSPIFPRWSMEKWQSEGHPPAIDILRRHTLHLLESLKPPQDHDELVARGEAFIRNLRIG
jgi:trimethylamine--corrinoid protein Co-methyltransferase